MGIANRLGKATCAEIKNYDEAPFVRKSGLLRDGSARYGDGTGRGRAMNRSRSGCFLLLTALLGVGSVASLAAENTPAATELQTGDASSMSDQSMMRDLFDRWERVWHEGQFDLVPSCVGEHYIRHDENGDRTVTREAYAAEIAKIRQERPDIRVVVYDHGFEGNRAWFRFAFKWTDAKTGEPRAVARACSLTEPRAVSLLRRGCQCSLSGRRGATPPLRSIGRARRRSSEGRALPSAA